MSLVRCVLPVLALALSGVVPAAAAPQSLEKRQASSAHGPRFVYVCEDAPPFAIRFFETDPPSARLDAGAGPTMLVIQRSGSGARYAGARHEFWGKGREASLSVPGGATHRCRVAHESP